MLTKAHYFYRQYFIFLFTILLAFHLQAQKEKRDSKWKSPSGLNRNHAKEIRTQILSKLKGSDILSTNLITRQSKHTLEHNPNTFPIYLTLKENKDKIINSKNTNAKVDLSQLPLDMQKSILSKFFISQSAKISLAKLKKIILFIMKDVRYYDVKIFKDTDKNKFNIKALSKSSWKNIRIKGVKKININKIQNLISDTIINKDHLSLIRKIKSIYEDEGFFHTSIKMSLSNDILQLNITEGEITYIKEFNFISENRILNNLLKRSLIRYKKIPLNRKNKKRIEKKIKDISYKNKYFHLKYEIKIIHKK